MTIAVYPGSHDPFTWGHWSIVCDTLRAVRKVVVAVAQNPAKRHLMSAERRLACVQSYFEGSMEVTAELVGGVVADYCAALARKEGEQVILVRGLRAVSDFEAEMALAAANRELQGGIQTIFIPTSPKWSFVSSTTVREVAKLTMSVERLMPYVNAAVANSVLEALAASGSS